MPYDHADLHPPRFAVFEGDFPKPPESFEAIQEEQASHYREETVEAHPSIQFEFARAEREELLRRSLAGHTAQQAMYPRPPEGALSPREQQRVVDYQEASREHRGGLPDSSPAMKPVPVVGGRPMRFG